MFSPHTKQRQIDDVIDGINMVLTNLIVAVISQMEKTSSPLAFIMLHSAFIK